MVAKIGVVLDSLIRAVSASSAKLVNATPAMAESRGKMPATTEPNPISRTKNAMRTPMNSVSVLVLAWATCPPKLTLMPAALAGPPESKSAFCAFAVTFPTATGKPQRQRRFDRPWIRSLPGRGL